MPLISAKYNFELFRVFKEEYLIMGFLNLFLQILEGSILMRYIYSINIIHKYFTEFNTTNYRK